MRRRVKIIIGENADLSLITTYHGFCVRVLREDINKLCYPKNFIIMDIEDQKTVLREVFKELGIDHKVSINMNMSRRFFAFGTLGILISYYLIKKYGDSFKHAIF